MSAAARLRLDDAARARLGWALAGVVLLGWIAATVLSGTDPFGPADAASYWTEAGALVDHGEMRESFDTGTTPSTWRPPLYGAWLGLLRGAGAGPELAARANQLFLLGTAALLLLCARRLGLGRGAAAAVALAYLCYPTGNRLAGTLMSESLFLLLAVAALAVALSGAEAAPRRREAARLLACGLLCGLALLTRTVFYAWIPGVIALALAGRRPLRRRAAAGLVVLGLIAAVGPWTVRNAALHGRLVAVNTSGAYNLWVGNALDDTGVRDPGLRAWLAELRATSSEVEVADELSARAWASVRARPGDAVERWAGNALALWMTTRSVTGSRAGELALIALQIVLLFTAALALYFEPRRRALWALASILLLTTGLHAVTFVEWRFALPLLPPALLLSAHGFAGLARQRGGA